MVETVETIIIGGGQAGLSASYFLSKAKRENLVLEKSNLPGHAWRNQRWDSFTFVTPNWSFQLPGGEYRDKDPNGYMNRSEIVRRFENYVQLYELPVAYNTEVTRVEPENGSGYRVRTAEKEYRAHNVILANGFLQEGKVPEFAAKIPASILQIHSSQYHNPQSLPKGAVLVVGSAQSGMQIAEEIYQSGRKLFLATSGAGRAPRRYRGKDIFDWLYLMRFFEQSFDDFLAAGRLKFVPPHVTGKNGGYALNLHQFFRDGVTLLGHARDYEDGKLILAGDLIENLNKSDGAEIMMLKNIDDFIQRTHLDAPEEQIDFLKDAYQAASQARDLTALDLMANRVGTIIWACGYQYDLSILPFPMLNKFGFPDTQRGVSRYPGLYFIGIPFQSKLKSGFLFGVAEDAAYIADQITHPM